MLEYDVNGYHVKVSKVRFYGKDEHGNEKVIEFEPKPFDITCEGKEIKCAIVNSIISKAGNLFKRDNITEINQSVINGSSVIMSSGDVIVKE